MNRNVIVEGSGTEAGKSSGLYVSIQFTPSPGIRPILSGSTSLEFRKNSESSRLRNQTFEARINADLYSVLAINVIMLRLINAYPKPVTTAMVGILSPDAASVL